MTSSVIPEGSVIITPTAMYAEMQATHQAVRDVANKLDGALSDHGRRLDEHEKDLGDHETRIRSVERRILMAVGALIAVQAGAVAVVIQVIPKH